MKVKKQNHPPPPPPLPPLPATRIAGFAHYKPISVGRPGDVRYMTPSHHPTTPGSLRDYLEALSKFKVSKYD